MFKLDVEDQFGKWTFGSGILYMSKMEAVDAILNLSSVDLRIQSYAQWIYHSRPESLQKNWFIRCQLNYEECVE